MSGYDLLEIERVIEMMKRKSVQKMTLPIQIDGLLSGGNIVIEMPTKAETPITTIHNPYESLRKTAQNKIKSPESVAAQLMSTMAGSIDDLVYALMTVVRTMTPGELHKMGFDQIVLDALDKGHRVRGHTFNRTVVNDLFQFGQSLVSTSITPEPYEPELPVVDEFEKDTGMAT